ncbi:Hypothetical predicted protein [Octopus vulgaris]|uniref:Uncharacterized protein n=1 Tax=Octopus vulgaris TaxID=6645 RepID=A0AA36EZJ8_OCTVU|nr:Hypothetical predicted protein [Octopus vulgaris]
MEEKTVILAVHLQIMDFKCFKITHKTTKNHTGIHKDKVKYHSKESRVKKFNIEALQDPKTRVAFQQRLQVNLQNKTPNHLVEENWNQLKETIITACEETIGRKKRKHQDWFDDNDEALKELIDQKRKAFISSQNDPKSVTKRVFQKVQSRSSKDNPYPEEPVKSSSLQM